MCDRRVPERPILCRGKRGTGGRLAVRDTGKALLIAYSYFPFNTVCQGRGNFNDVPKKNRSPAECAEISC